MTLDLNPASCRRGWSGIALGEDCLRIRWLSVLRLPHGLCGYGKRASRCRQRPVSLSLETCGNVSEDSAYLGKQDSAVSDVQACVWRRADSYGRGIAGFEIRVIDEALDAGGWFVQRDHVGVNDQSGDATG